MNTQDGSLGFDAYLTANPIAGQFTAGLESLSQAKQFIVDLEKGVEKLFGIGIGRNEADLITPYQNQLGAPGGILNTAQILAELPEHQNPEDLNQLYQITLQAVNAFYKYIGHPAYPKSQWPDGRASKQAYASISAFAPGILASIKDRLIGVGGTLQAIPDYSQFGGIGSQLTNKLQQLDSIESGRPILGIRLASNTGLLILGGLGLLAFMMLRGKS